MQACSGAEAAHCRPERRRVAGCSGIWFPPGFYGLVSTPVRPVRQLQSLPRPSGLGCVEGNCPTDRRSRGGEPQQRRAPQGPAARTRHGGTRPGVRASRNKRPGPEPTGNNPATPGAGLLAMTRGLRAEVFAPRPLTPIPSRSVGAAGDAAGCWLLGDEARSALKRQGAMTTGRSLCHQAHTFFRGPASILDALRIRFAFEPFIRVNGESPAWLAQQVFADDCPYRAPAGPKSRALPSLSRRPSCLL